MSDMEHRITDIWQDSECASWRCSCGVVGDGYAEVAEAREAAAEHGLLAPVSA